MTTVAQLVGEFIDAWTAGRRPDAGAFLARAAEGERADLAAQLATWLEMAPTPDYDEAARRSIAAEPALMAAVEAAAALRTPLAERLPTLRARAGLAVRDVAGRLTQLFGLSDEGRAADYLERIEREQLDERRLSRRLLDGLAVILDVDRDQLAPRSAALAGGQALFRAEDDAGDRVAQDIDALSRAALCDAPGAPMDELDRLFLGGPGG